MSLGYISGALHGMRNMSCKDWMVMFSSHVHLCLEFRFQILEILNIS